MHFKLNRNNNSYIFVYNSDKKRELLKEHDVIA